MAMQFFCLDSIDVSLAGSKRATPQPPKHQSNDECTDCPIPLSHDGKQNSPNTKKVSNYLKRFGNTSIPLHVLFNR